MSDNVYVGVANNFTACKKVIFVLMVVMVTADMSFSPRRIRRHKGGAAWKMHKYRAFRANWSIHCPDLRLTPQLLGTPPYEHETSTDNGDKFVC